MNTFEFSDEQLAAYRDGRLDDVSATAVEERLMVDERLRLRLGTLAEPSRLAETWIAVERTLDQPAPSRLARLAMRLGVPEPATRLAGATPTLTRSWLAGIGVIMLVTVVISNDRTQGDTRFLGYLLLAPLVVIASVAAAYGRSSDPSHEITIAAPVSGGRLLLWRTAAVAPLAALANLFVGLLVGAGGWTLAWIVPAVACTFAMLALSTSISVQRAAAIVAVAYLSIAGIGAVAAAQPVQAFTGPGQATALAVAVVAAIILWVRRGALEKAVVW